MFNSSNTIIKIIITFYFRLNIGPLLSNTEKLIHLLVYTSKCGQLILAHMPEVCFCSTGLQ